MPNLQFPIFKEPLPPYSITPIDNVLRSETENGYEFSRRRYTKMRHNIQLKWEFLTTAERDTLDTFYTNYSATHFDLPIIVESNGLKTTKTFVVKFSSPPTMNYVGMGLWDAEISCREV